MLLMLLMIVNNTSNTQDSTHSQFSTVTITLDYYFVAVPPMVIVIQPLPVVVSTTIELICIVTGVDPPRISTWAFNETVIHSGLETTGINISREISSTDYGIYTCSASNEFGDNSRTIEVIQAGKITYFMFQDNTYIMHKYRYIVEDGDCL